MVKLEKNNPLFLGLTHIGQVYSSSWAKKVGPCSIYDFNKGALEKFKNKKFTQEEPNLKYLQNKKIIFLNNENEIKKHSLIFFTYDTPINTKNGSPNLLLIENLIKRLLSFEFEKKTVIIITTQVYPGFMDKIKKKYKSKKNIKFIYMVDTLKMGMAIDNFLNPEQLIFGGDEKDKKIIKSIFYKFKCKKYLFSFKEAELIKISINLYLFFSVTYANMLDGLGRENNIQFSKIISSLRNDKRIGNYSYIHPSLGMAGGHLERDSFYFQKINRSIISGKILSEMFKFNKFRKELLIKKIKEITKNKINRILLVGFSYKESSFSIVNSVFSNLLKSSNFKTKIFDDHYDLNRFKNLDNIENLKNLKSFDLIIYNYAKNNNIKILDSFLRKNKKKNLLNISLSQKNKFKGPNVHNLFSNEVSEIK
jgi:nucleotide sugar dehydrogenase